MTLSCLNPCFSGCWSRTARRCCPQNKEYRVLILVLVDVGLGRRLVRIIKELRAVLILVLVDVGLGHRCASAVLPSGGVVLILVLVDVGLGLSSFSIIFSVIVS